MALKKLSNPFALAIFAIMYLPILTVKLNNIELTMSIHTTAVLVAILLLFLGIITVLDEVFKGLDRLEKKSSSRSE